MKNEVFVPEFKKLRSLDEISLGDWFLIASPKRLVRVTEKDTVGVRNPLTGAMDDMPGYIVEATYPTTALNDMSGNCVHDAHDAKQVKTIHDTSKKHAEKSGVRWTDSTWEEAWAVRQVIITHIKPGTAAYKDKDERRAPEVFCAVETRQSGSARRTSPLEGRKIEAIKVKPAKGLEWDVDDGSLPNNVMSLKAIAVKEGIEVPEDCRKADDLKNLINEHRGVLQEA